MARTQRPLHVAVVALFTLSILALGLVQTGRDRATLASPILVVRDVPVLSTTTAAPTTTVAPAAVSHVVKAGPATPPRNGYAPEPIIKIGTIEIPKIALVSPIYHGITLRNIDFGPSHWPGTAMPGEVGNSVFAGHRVTHTHPFLHIDQLVPGDEVIFTVNGVRSVYTMTGHDIVKPDALWIANPTPTATATLFGCHPPHFATYRYVVHLALVGEPNPTSAQPSA
jgi:sortase A